MLAEGSWSAVLKGEITALKDHFQNLAKEWDRPIPQYVYHYTSLDTLCRILEGRTIRLYDLMSMEDKEEFLHPLRIVSESMRPYWNELNKLLVTSFFHEESRIKLNSTWNAFVTCFCEAAETEHMWTKYGDGASGAAIRCSGLDLRSQPDSHAVYPMMYNDAWFKATLRCAHEYAVSRKWVDQFGFEEGKVIGYKYCERILRILLCVKRECFRPESEWRALLLDSSGAYDTDRGRRFVKIPLLPEYVSAIVLGPKAAPTSEARLEALIATTPYQKTAVTRSTLSI